MCHVVHTQLAALVLSCCQPRALWALWAQADSRSTRGTHGISAPTKQERTQQPTARYFKCCAYGTVPSSPVYRVIIAAAPCSFTEASLSPYAWQKAAFEGTNMATPIQRPTDHCKGQSQQPFLNVVKPTSNSWLNQESNHGKWPELFGTSIPKPSKFFKISKVTRN